jgi:arsenite/tail-anchored protein-transporting ATPase
VGKTTVSSAYAAHCAAKEKGARVLLISTDPAHSLGDVLEMKLSDAEKRVNSRGRLFARQIDPEAEVRRFMGENREGLLGVIESGTFFTREEIEPLLDASLPGMAELAALLAIDRYVERDEYDEVVVDTAPIGHTLRMMETPQHLAKVLEFLETASMRDQAIARQFAGRRLEEKPAVAEWRRMVERIQQLLGGRDSRIVLVTTAEEFALEESWRAMKQMAEMGLRPASAVLNRAVTSAKGCARCERRMRQTKSALREMKRHFGAEAIRVGEDPGGPILGAEELRAFGRHVFEGRALKATTKAPTVAREVELEAAEWPELDVALTFTLGKGGVGKTTISAALAARSRETNAEEGVTICSIDPAPSLDDVFETEVGDEPRAVLGDANLKAAEFDAVSAFRAWAERLKDKIEGSLAQERGGLHVDLTYERKILASLMDITPPGIDELFAVFRIRELAAKRGRVVIDMAPTGHALEMLRTPARMLSWSRLLLKSLAPHRTLALAQDAAVEIATVSQQVREFNGELQDAGRAKAWPVMLAEPLPDRETARLLDGLAESGIGYSGIFVNRVLSAVDVKGCAKCGRARRWQLATLAGMRRKYKGVEILCVPEAAREIKGKRGLKAFTRKLWRIK